MFLFLYSFLFWLIDYSIKNLIEKTNSSDSIPPRKIVKANIKDNGKEVEISGVGNGPVSAMLDALKNHSGMLLDVVTYAENSIGSGSETKAASYFELKDQQGRIVWGVGVDNE